MPRQLIFSFRPHDISEEDRSWVDKSQIVKILDVPNIDRFQRYLFNEELLFLESCEKTVVRRTDQLISYVMGACNYSF